MNTTQLLRGSVAGSLFAEDYSVRFRGAGPAPIGNLNGAIAPAPNAKTVLFASIVYRSLVNSIRNHTKPNCKRDHYAH